MITIKFFASLRQQLGQDETSMAVETPTSIQAIKQKLISQGEVWEQTLSTGKVLCALNYTLVEESTLVESGDEIAFFPPVTGG